MQGSFYQHVTDRKTTLWFNKKRILFNRVKAKSLFNNVKEGKALLSFIKKFPYTKNSLFQLFISSLRIAQNFRGERVTENACFCKIFQKCNRKRNICTL